MWVVVVGGSGCVGGGGSVCVGGGGRWEWMCGWWW